MWRELDKRGGFAWGSTDKDRQTNTHPPHSVCLPCPQPTSPTPQSVVTEFSLPLWCESTVSCLAFVSLFFLFVFFLICFLTVIFFQLLSSQKHLFARRSVLSHRFPFHVSVIHIFSPCLKVNLCLLTILTDKNVFIMIFCRMLSYIWWHNLLYSFLSTLQILYHITFSQHLFFILF